MNSAKTTIVSPLQPMKLNPFPTRSLATAAALTLGFAAFSSLADVKMPAIFSDHMVLQAKAQLPVWGWADPGEKVTVTVGNRRASTVAGADGKWSVKLGSLKTGETLSMTVSGKNTVTIHDVLVGEVWLGSGQSNMEFSVRSANNAEAEAKAAHFPAIRMFTVKKNPSPQPLSDCEGSWAVCTPENVPRFSAALYFFGRELHQQLGVPVGLIHSSWGGTPVESWASLDAQKDQPEMKPLMDSWTTKLAVPFDTAKARAEHDQKMAQWKVAADQAKADGKQGPRQPQMASDPGLNPWRPANLYNGMIAPVVPYAIQGAIWYQGESNAGSLESGALYHLQLATMIKDWRKRWGTTLAFGIVQLPEFHSPVAEPVQHTGWVLVRESMLKTLSLPRTGMAVALGLGEANDIHPKNKQDVGRRLASWALDDVYDVAGFAEGGPIVTKHKIRKNEITLIFKNTDGGLGMKGKTLKGFAIAGADKKWVRAEARIDGNNVVVSSPEVPHPVAVRYAWADNPEFSLFNGMGLPASPFRTDDWK
jgi:hypothetical protein